MKAGLLSLRPLHIARPLCVSLGYTFTGYLNSLMNVRELNLQKKHHFADSILKGNKAFEF